MEKIALDYVENYCEPEDELLKQLSRETALTQLHHRMLSGNYQGHLLAMFVKLFNAESVLEIGTYAGYSTICIARALPENGKITTIEVNDEIQWLSEKYFEKSGMKNKINALLGDAKEIIPNLNQEFDLVFIDGDKREYIEYYNLVFPKLRKGGLILADNVLWNNKIFGKIESNDYMTKGILKFNEYIAQDKRVEKLILPVRDGLMMIIKN
jgi:predicted O-methyltransferase YrrM